MGTLPIRGGRMGYPSELEGNVHPDSLQPRIMAHSYYTGNVVEFTSKTLVSLNEEIDRFIKRKKLRGLFPIRTQLAASYHRPYGDGGEGEPLWHLSMRMEHED